MSETPSWENDAREKINRRKKVQAGLSTGSAITALAGTGAVVGAHALRRSPKALNRAIPKAVKERVKNAGITSEGVKDMGTQTAVVGTGVGGVSSLNFADVQRREANLDRRRAEHKQSLVGKASASVAVPFDDPAWGPARSRAARTSGTERERQWRDEVSEGARRQYDTALAPQRQRADAQRRIGWALQAAGTAGGAGAAAGLKGPARALGAAPLAAGTAGNVVMRRRAGDTELRSAKIRARGFKRLADKEHGEGLAKAFNPAGAGGYTKSAVVRPTGNKAGFTRNAVPQRPTKAPQIVARRTV